MNEFPGESEREKEKVLKQEGAKPILIIQNTKITKRSKRLKLAQDNETLQKEERRKDGESAVNNCTLV